MKKKEPLIRLIKNIEDNDRGIFWICGLYTLIALCVPLFSIALPKVLIQELTGENPTLRDILSIVIIFFASGAIFYFLKTWLHDVGYPRLTSLRIGYVRDLAVKLLKIDYKYMESAAFFENRTTAFESTSTNNNGVEGIYHKLFELPQLCLLIIALSVFIGLKNPLILLAILVNITATTVVAIAVQRYNYKRKEDLSRHERRVRYYAEAAQNFTYGKDVRLYNLKERIADNFKSEIQGYTDVFRIIKNKEYRLGFFTLFTLLISDVTTYGMLTWMTVRGMSISDYSMYIVASSTLSIQMTALSENITFIMNEYLYVRDYYTFADEDLGEQGGTEKAAAPGTPLEIEFDHVTFCYPETENTVFDDFSLKIPAGQKLALVGINGAGKTTFVKLLTGLFRVDSGSIRINGKDITSYQKSELFRMFAVVFQDVNIFSYTIAENIACSSNTVDFVRVDGVLKQVGMYEKIQSLERGANTMMLKIIDENGVVFSGGESQKLAIARALYKGGNCVIMDEPTSALDALAEAEIYSEFDTLTRGKTAVYISHRLASTKFCDKIALIDGSGLREYGSHDELMELGGVYHDMFVTQGKYYQEGGDER